MIGYQDMVICIKILSVNVWVGLEDEKIAKTILYLQWDCIENGECTGSKSKFNTWLNLIILSHSIGTRYLTREFLHKSLIF